MIHYKIELVIEAPAFVTQEDVISDVWHSDLPYRLVENIVYRIELAEDYDE